MSTPATNRLHQLSPQLSVMKRPTTSTPSKEAEADSAAPAAESTAAISSALPQHPKAANEADPLLSLAASQSSMACAGFTQNGAKKHKSVQKDVNTLASIPIRETLEGDADSERGSPPKTN